MKKNYKTIIFICVAVLLGNAAVKYYFVKGQGKKISILQKAAANARSSSPMNPDKRLQQVSDDQNDIKQIMGKIPEEFLFTEYASRIRALIDENHLSIDGNLVFKPEKSDILELVRYNTNIAASGDYLRIKALISDLLNLPGLVYFKSGSITRKKENPDKIKLNLLVSVFFKKEQNETL